MAAKSDDELHAVPVLDKVITVLEEIGYTGAPHRETLKTTICIVQYRAAARGTLIERTGYQHPGARSSSI